VKGKSREKGRKKIPGTGVNSFELLGADLEPELQIPEGVKRKEGSGRAEEVSEPGNQRNKKRTRKNQKLCLQQAVRGGCLVHRGAGRHWPDQRKSLQGRSQPSKRTTAKNSGGKWKYKNSLQSTRVRGGGSPASNWMVK